MNTNLENFYQLLSPIHGANPKKVADVELENLLSPIHGANC